MGIASERGDVSSHPLQRKLLVHDSIVSRGMLNGFRSQGRVGQEAQSAEPIVDGNDDHIALVDQLCRNVVIAFPDCQRTAMDPYHHGISARLASTVIGCEDV